MGESKSLVFDHEFQYLNPLLLFLQLMMYAALAKVMAVVVVVVVVVTAAVAEVVLLCHSFQYKALV